MYNFKLVYSNNIIAVHTRQFYVHVGLNSCYLSRRDRCQSHESLETKIIDQHEKTKQSGIAQMAESASAEKSLQSLESSLEDLMQRFLLLRDDCTNLENVSLSSS